MLSALFALGVVASGLSAAALLTPGGPLEPIWMLNPRAREGFATMGIWAPLLMAIVCVWCAASAYGFFCARPWGYWSGLSLLVTNMMGDLVNVALGIEPRAIFGLPVVAFLLWYLSRASVRAFFAQPSADRYVAK